MDSSFLARQVEVYSNAIVAFIVIQGLAYVYYFGTSVFFNCLVKTSTFLAEGLVILFFLVTTLSIIAIRFLGKTLSDLSIEFSNIIRKIYMAKCLIVLMFGLLQVIITLAYAVMIDPDTMECL